MTNLDTSFDDVIRMIETRRNNAIRKVNEELVGLYYDCGKYVSNKVKNEKWGSKTIDKLATYIKNKYPKIKGFNRPGIYRMKQFYETYKDSEIVSIMLRQLGWSIHILILNSTKSIEEKEIYTK